VATSRAAPVVTPPGAKTPAARARGAKKVPAAGETRSLEPREAGKAVDG
jgi:hypothetical protein